MVMYELYRDGVRASGVCDGEGITYGGANRAGRCDGLSGVTWL